MILTLLVLFWLPPRLLGEEVCYDLLDCFSDSKPWSGTPQRQKIPLPWSPKEINTRFFLLTRENPSKHQEIDARDVKSVRASLFHTLRRTCFIIHGMGDRAENNWVPPLCHEILQVEDVNCIGVDWHRGSGNILIYSQATSNVRVVGAEIANVLRTWQEELHYPPTNVHLIGHSLGAHVAGEAGKRHPGVRRITGLDPARLLFEGTPSEVSLDASDAEFVDVIHTDASPLFGLGLVHPVGHFDFYPNGGRDMPGCANELRLLNNMDAIVGALACNHLRAFHYYTESVRSPGGFLAYPCANYQMFKAGGCFPCPADDCPPMGHFSEATRRRTAQTFFLQTGAEPGRFSSHRYKVTVTIVGSRAVSGQIFVALFGDEISSNEHQVTRGKFTGGNSYSGFIDSDIRLDAVNCVDFRWTPPPPQTNILQSKMGAGRIDVQSGADGSVLSFCTTGTVREKKAQTLGLCRDMPYGPEGYRAAHQAGLQ